jgi:FkbM family methyltransferase
MRIQGKLALNVTRALHETGVFALLDRRRDSVEVSKADKQRSFSSCGEDLFFQEYFGSHRGTYIDIGGNHPLRDSSTYLLYRMGWTGVVVEPIQRLYEKHKQLRPKDIQVLAASGECRGSLTFYEMIPSVLSTCDAGRARLYLSKGEALIHRQYTVPVLTVSDICQQYLAGRPVDLLSIDTEGHDLAVLRGIDWREVRPQMVVCEAHDGQVAAATTDLFAAQGYRHVKSLGYNLMFARH